MSISTLKAGVKPMVNLICHLWPALTQCSVNKLYGTVGFNTQAVHLKTWTAIIRKWEKEGFLPAFDFSDWPMTEKWFRMSGKCTSQSHVLNFLQHLLFTEKCPKVFPMWSHWQSSAFICKVHTLSFKSLGLVRLFCNVSCLVCSPSCIYHQRDNTVIVWTIIIIYYYFNNY